MTIRAGLAAFALTIGAALLVPGTVQADHRHHHHGHRGGGYFYYYDDAPYSGYGYSYRYRPYYDSYYYAPYVYRPGYSYRRAYPPPDYYYYRHAPRVRGHVSLFFGF